MQRERQLPWLAGLFLVTGMSAVAEASLARLDITLGTTSDWCRLETVASDPVAVVDYQVVVDESPNEEIGNLRIFQWGHTEAMEVRYTTYLLLDDLSGDLRWASTKGDWGDVTIAITGFVAGSPVVLRDFSNPGSIPGDPTNRREFTIPRADLLRLDSQESIGAAEGVPRTVFAFYYPWYGSPDGPHGAWFHWDPGNQYASTHEPLLGYYDSGATSIQLQHLEWAEAHGVDVFISSWWGIGSYEDRRFRELLGRATRFPVKLSIYFETNGEIEDSPPEERPAVVKKHLRHILEEYGHHQSFFRFEGKPVIFLYGLPLSRLTTEQWETVLGDLRGEGREFFISADSFDLSRIRVFDGFHTYNPLHHTREELLSIFRRNLLVSSYQDKIYAATVLPGYDDTVIRDPGIQVDRENGGFYAMQWSTLAETQPAWVLITSWNEWHEGSEIEPSVEHGTQYLELTRGGRALWDRPRFLRGDCNADGRVVGEVSDATFLLSYLFLGGPAPSCVAACDVDGDGFVTGQVTDAVYLLRYNFLGGLPPPPPFPECGRSQLATDVQLGCDVAPKNCP